MSLRRTLANVFRFLAACAADARSRRALLLLDDRLLRDIGVSQREALMAAKRPLWIRSRARMGSAFPERDRRPSPLRKALEG
jgi:uncharacterized protein YjiS (DUF1127 family)